MLVKAVSTTTLLLMLFSTTASADELADLKRRNAQLEATVQELTLQLAEALKAQQRLEAELAAAVSVSSEEAVELQDTAIATEVVTASGAAASSTSMKETTDGVCNVREALDGYEGSGGDNKALSAWLKSSNHLAVCTTSQLQQIRKAVDWDLLGYQKEVLALIDRELASR